MKKEEPFGVPAVGFSLRVLLPALLNLVPHQVVICIFLLTLFFQNRSHTDEHIRMRSTQYTN
jgi:hypothetical protein